MKKRDRDTTYHYMSGAQELHAHPGKRERLDVYHFRRSTVNKRQALPETEITRETLEEFLARGGAIQHVSPGVALGAMTTSARYVRCSSAAMTSADGNSRTGRNTTS